MSMFYYINFRFSLNVVCVCKFLIISSFMCAEFTMTQSTITSTNRTGIKRLHSPSKQIDDRAKRSVYHVSKDKPNDKNGMDPLSKLVYSDFLLDDIKKYLKEDINYTDINPPKNDHNSSLHDTSNTIYYNNDDEGWPAFNESVLKVR